jgi:hypothetical protein
MFDKFGEFDTYEELNKAADGQKTQGDIEALKELAAENGIDPGDVEDYVDGVIPELCTDKTAALGKLSVEIADIKASEIVQDWIDYIQASAMEDLQMSLAIRKKGKSLIGCIGAILKWSYNAKYKVDERIIKASGIGKIGMEIYLGMPGMASAKKIIREYYMEG